MSFKQKYKIVIISSMLFTLIPYGLFILAMYQQNKILFYICFTTPELIDGVYPMFMEMGCEVGYPIKEVNNVLNSLFMLLQNCEAL